MALIIISWQTASRADEIVIDSRFSSPIELGGVSWAPQLGLSGSVLELSAASDPTATLQTCELTAGELWRFYKSQGMDSVDHLVVVLSVPNTAIGDQLVLEGVQLKIADGRSAGDSAIVLADAGEGNRVVIAGGQSFSGQTKAKMMIPLGFDFMQQYSADSTDKLVLNYKIEGASFAESPVFMVEGSQFWARFPTLAMVAVFVGFWLVLFWVLKVVTFVQPKLHSPAAMIPVLPKNASEVIGPGSPAKLNETRADGADRDKTNGAPRSGSMARSVI